MRVVRQMEMRIKGGQQIKWVEKGLYKTIKQGSGVGGWWVGALNEGYNAMG